MTPIARDTPLTRDVGQMIANRVSRDLGMRAPQVVWSERVRNGFYRMQEIHMGPNVWGHRLDTFLHELAHHVDAALWWGLPDSERSVKMSWGHHGPRFREILELVVEMVYGDPDLYDWNEEYRSITSWAAKGRPRGKW